MEFNALDWIEGFGWLASLLTIATYSMNSMIPLRVFAIASSVCFVVYAFILQLWPLLLMELILLPINCFRFWQIITLRGRLSRSSEESTSDFSIIKTYGQKRTIDANTCIFRRGDPVDSLFFVANGRVLIEEVGVEIRPGDIFGEIAFFTDAATRTATARTLEQAEVYEIDRKRFMRLQFEDPSFGMSVMRTITRRLAANGPFDIGSPASVP